MTSLTLGNVLLDAVELLTWIKSTIPGAKESKVITYGSLIPGVSRGYAEASLSRNVLRCYCELCAVKWPHFGPA